MRGAFGGIVPIVSERGKPQLNAGALQRYLAEAVWFPTALLPSQGVKWSAADDSTARATLSDCGTTVTLEFRFNDRGEIIEVFAPDRFREVKGRYEPTPWTGRFSNYQEREGVKIPLEGEVEWQVWGKPLPYWRGTITDIRYELPHSSGALDVGDSEAHRIRVIR